MLHAELARQRGDPERTIRFAQQALDQASEDDQYLRYLSRWNLAVAALMQGRVGEAEEALADLIRDPWASGPNRFFAVRVCYALAQAQRGQGRLGAALGTCQEALELATAAGRSSLQALALWAGSKKDRAVGTLAKAVALGEPEGYVRTFVDEGPPMVEVLSGVLNARQRGSLYPPVPAHYLRKLLAATERDATGAPPPTDGLPEPLTGRELEVLVLIAAGKSNRRIAQELYVGAGTVKTHIRNLYRKLEVRSRTQALARARELNLI